MLDLDVSRRLRTHYAATNRLLKLHLDLLYACDLDCEHCYLDNKSRSQVSTETIIDVLDQAADLGALNLQLSGGEIFLRKDLFQILEHVRKRRFYVRLKTHGGRITADDARRLKELAIGNVDFSVYAMADDVHDAFTRRKGSLKRTLEGIDLLVEQGINVQVNCSISTRNYAYYQQLQQHFGQRNIPVRVEAYIRGTNDALETDICNLNVTHEERVQVNLYKIDQDGSLPNRSPLPPAHENRLCYAGATLVYVAPDLKVYPCVSFPMECGDLNTSTLKEIWESAPGLQEIRYATRADVSACGSCSAGGVCAYCMGVSYIESGGETWKKPAALTCDSAFAKLEAEARYAAGESPMAIRPPPKRNKLVQFPIMSSDGSTTTSVCSQC